MNAAPRRPRRKMSARRCSNSRRKGSGRSSASRSPTSSVTTKYGRIKKIPIARTWHHKSCGQCGHIPGYSTSIFWLIRKLGLDYDDPTDQTSCTAWNYYASATSNAGRPGGCRDAQLRGRLRVGLLPDHPLRHVVRPLQGGSRGARPLGELRDEVRRICDKLGKPFVMPEEIVHYSEWVYAMRDEIAEATGPDLSNIAVTVHPACHYYKLVAGRRDLRPGRLRRPAHRRS